MDAQCRHIVRSRLGAMFVGLAAAFIVLVFVFCSFPAQAQLVEGKEYGYVYSGAKSTSTSFVAANLSAESLIVFGSSEFSTPKRLVPQVPSGVFGSNNYGLRLMLIGEAFDQSLWHSIALGAHDEAGNVGAKTGDKKAAIIVAPGWFVDGGQDAETFQTRFSYSLYQQFCANPQIAPEQKEYVAARLAELGIDEAQLHAAQPAFPHDWLNAWTFSALDDLKLRRDLPAVRASGSELVSTQPSQSPDFSRLRAEALETAKSMTDSNEWGLENSFYTTQLAPVFDELKDYRADESYTHTPEYDDLDCFLSIADACGIDVLVIISPVLGPYYDHIGIDAQTRETCYSRIRELVAQHSADEGRGTAQLADFSSHEYEMYFLYDIVHFGWLGWLDVEESLYHFARGDV